MVVAYRHCSFAKPQQVMVDRLVQPWQPLRGTSSPRCPGGHHVTANAGFFGYLANCGLVGALTYFNVALG
ncbi:hypothetical protein OEM_51460 [Mycobacterium intracellulare subsp. yongonense 05-1390]|nr:hypothetical protein OEM_51460 [Mycobacterium intracellulare subsp. yongonense 05-1390]ARR80746.1 hypothetical protein MOTT12_05082 [Mycobacterium intracellulare subsp. yongonense]BCP28921.1 hypothetical protein MINTM025_52770 [Mycobacterium intracellulare]BCP45490.1 hypothetical protein MINTMi27_55830 [Mycobacterium intracellulare]